MNPEVVLYSILPLYVIDRTVQRGVESFIARSLQNVVVLGDMYNTTNSNEIKQVIACLVPIEYALAHQTHLDEQQAVYTIKRLKEQRVVNKDH